jgi:23S rRNA (uridine2552-2'-O)-methyltransferase
LGGKADLVLSDMAPNTTGHSATDHLRIMALAELAAHFAREVLAPEGSFVAKVFQGGSERAMLDALKRDFTSVRHAKPPASRKESSELYVVAMGFRGGSASD